MPGSTQAMTLPDVFTRYRGQIDAGLQQALAGREGALYDMLRYHLGWQDEHGAPNRVGGGKGGRPALCLFGAEVLGGKQAAALPAAIALELVHNFSLIHDDIQDGDTERHHRSTVWYIWGHGNGIDAGVAMHGLANLALTMVKGAALPAVKQLEISQLITRASLQMIEGQVLDITYEQRPTVRVNDYLTMIEKKTGALLEAPLHAGAVIATDDPKQVQAMRAFGHELGRLFQIRDDMLGVWGEPAKTGKAAGNDIHRRKKSLPIVHALSTAEGEARERLTQVYKSDRPLTPVDVAEVTSVLDEIGTRRFCEELAKEHAASSLAAIRDLELAPSARRECEELTRFLLERDF